MKSIDQNIKECGFRAIAGYELDELTARDPDAVVAAFEQNGFRVIEQKLGKKNKWKVRVHLMDMHNNDFEPLERDLAEIGVKISDDNDGLEFAEVRLVKFTPPGVIEQVVTKMHEDSTSFESKWLRDRGWESVDEPVSFTNIHRVVHAILGDGSNREGKVLVDGVRKQGKFILGKLPKKTSPTLARHLVSVSAWAAANCLMLCFEDDGTVYLSNNFFNTTDPNRLPYSWMGMVFDGLAMSLKETEHDGKVR